MTTWHRTKSTTKRNGHVPFVCHSYPNIKTKFDENYSFVWTEIPLIGFIRKDSGFTLVELMITLVVAAVLLGLAVPNLRSFIQNSRIVTQSNEMIGSIAIARSEAIKRNKTMVICRSSNPTAASPTCANDNGNTWETGWIIFQDANGDNLYTAGTDTLLTIREPLAGNNTLRGNVSQLYNYIAFPNSGGTNLSAPAAGAAANHFKLCDQRGASSGRAIVIDPTGHARTETNSTFTSLACP